MVATASSGLGTSATWRIVEAKAAFELKAAIRRDRRL